MIFQIPEYTVHIYDPRKGEDYQYKIERNLVFSSLQYNFMALAIDINKEVSKPKLQIYEFAQITKLIETAMLQLGGKGFYIFSPLTKKVKESSIVELEEVDFAIDSVLGYFDIEHKTIGRIFETQPRLLTYEEWVVGSCSHEFEPPKKNSKWYQKVHAWSLEHLLAQADRINCLFNYSSEMNQAIILTRLFDKLDEALNKVK